MRPGPAAWLIVTVFGCCLPSSPSQARITRIEIATVEPAFAGQQFPGTGAYELVTGKAHGEVDPRSPANAIIQDIALAPRNGSGMVEYTTDIAILRPADPGKSNNILLFNVLNRGNKGAVSLFNADVPPQHPRQQCRQGLRRRLAAA